jgi:cytochrome d ubiquinol oxidase subunit I
VGARYLLGGRHLEEARIMLRMGIGLAAILAPLQLIIGDMHGLNTLKHQPMKVAAMEAHWDRGERGDFHIFAWPDEEAEENKFAISIPYGSALILTHDPFGQFPGLKEVPPQDRPPLLNVFFGFRIMLAIGFFMIAAALYGAWLMWRGGLFDKRWFLHVLAQSWWIGFVAVISGWVVTESGRQPWLVQGILRTADGVSPVPGSNVAMTLALFVIVYGIVFAMGIYYINRLIAWGLPAAVDQPMPTRSPIAAARGGG